MAKTQGRTGEKWALAQEESLYDGEKAKRRRRCGRMKEVWGEGASEGMLRRDVGLSANNTAQTTTR